MKSINSIFHTLMHNLIFKHQDKIGHLHHEHFHHLAIFIFFIFTVLGNFAPFRTHAASSLANVSALITDSRRGVVSTITFSFSTNNPTPAGGGLWDIEFSDAPLFASMSALNCPANTTPFVGALKAGCTADALQAAGSHTISIDITNPNTTGPVSFTINNYATVNGYGDPVTERAQVNIYITEGVAMTATINSTLNFQILGKDTGSNVNGVVCTATSTATSTPFGIIATSSPTTVCQEVRVSTNASHGFVVTVEQNHELMNSYGDTINSFLNSPDGTGSTSPALAWVAPSAILDSMYTYGHMGLTADDNIGLDEFGSSLYKGFSSTTPMTVFANTGPADGTALGIGAGNIAYTVQVSPLQEAGDYSSQLTYIVTPTY